MGHLGTGRLGDATLDRDGDAIYSAATAFARARIQDRERTGGRERFAVNSSGKPFEFQLGGFGDAFNRTGRSRDLGLTSSTIAAFKGGGFTGRNTGGRGNGATGKGIGFTPRNTGGATQPTSSTRPGTGGVTARQGGGSQPTSRSGAGTVQRTGGAGNAPGSTGSGTVRRTGSFGNTRSGRPIGGV